MVVADSCVVTALLSAFATIWVIKRIKNLKGPSGKTKDGDESVKEQEEPNIQVKVPQIQEKAIADFLDDLNVENNNDIEDRKNRLKTQLKEASKTKELVDKVCALLEGIDKGNIIQKIQDLKEKADSPVPQPLPKNNDCEKLIDHIKNKNDQQIRDAFNDAKNEDLVPFETLKRFINLLPSKRPSTPTPQWSFESEINKSENLPVLKKWLVEQFKLLGVTGLNPNGRKEDILDQIKKHLSDDGRPSDEKIIHEAVEQDQLTDEEKIILLRRLVEKIKEKVDDENMVIPVNVTDFIDKVARQLMIPNTQEEAQEQITKSHLEMINDVFGSQLDELSQEELKRAFENAISNRIKMKLTIFGAYTDFDALADDFKVLQKDKERVGRALENYKVEDIGELPEAVLKKKFEDISKSKKNELEAIELSAPVKSIDNLINQIIKAAEAAKEAEQNAKDICKGIENELYCKLKDISPSFESIPENLGAKNLINRYSESVLQREKELKKEIAEKGNTITQKQEEICQLRGEVQQKEETIAGLQTEKDGLEKDIKQAGQREVDDLHAKAELIVDSYRTFIYPCSDADESNCEDIDYRLDTQVNKAVERLKEYQVGTDQKPAEIRKAIQKLLLQELDVDNSPFNTICRYYAYSRLPFMTDKTREYGIIFDRKNIAGLFMAVDNLLVQFGINLDIPALFATGFAEGDYEDVTGKKYSDLDNLCPNSRNHFDNIDSKSKPEKVIVDMVQVGYSVDGKPSKKTSVLTF